MSDEASDDLAAAGWRRMSTIDEPRLSELIELYRESGFEVLLRPVSREELGDACAECLLAQSERFRTIYVRPARRADGD